MAPKRKRQSEATPTTSDTNKRVTRSSNQTRYNPELTGKGSDELKEPHPSPPKSSKPPKSKPTTASQRRKAHTRYLTSRPSLPPKPNPKSNQESADSSHPHSPTLTPSTLSTPVLPKPILLHHYTPHTSFPVPLLLLFTHGAGGTLSSPAVTHFCTGFATQYSILAFQGSSNLANRVKGFHACLPHVKELRRELATKRKQPGSPGVMVLGGRSMGARAAVIAAGEILEGAMAAEEDEKEEAKVADKKAKEKGKSDAKKSRPSDLPRIRLILVSYPLICPSKTSTTNMRDQILLNLPSSIDVLFIIGDKDAMCPLDLLNATRKGMAATSKLVVVRGANHGMSVVPKKAEQQVGEKSGRVAAAWCGLRISEDEDMVEIGDGIEDDW